MSLSFFKRVQLKLKRQSGKYYNIVLGKEDIETGAFKQHLGGGADEWEKRGEFQKFFLQSQGMKEANSLLDIGCGPGRASTYLVDYLNTKNYAGFDYNADFVSIANKAIVEQNLSSKQPDIRQVLDFDMKSFDREFDFLLAFSVLNHCSDEQRSQFFENLIHVMHNDSRLFITHAGWFRASQLQNYPLRLTQTFDENDLDVTQYSWRKGKSIFPILELTSKNS